ncbi:unnamed protein product [Boreogadus saida]
MEAGLEEKEVELLMAEVLKHAPSAHSKSLKVQVKIVCSPVLVQLWTTRFSLGGLALNQVVQSLDQEVVQGLDQEVVEGLDQEVVEGLDQEVVEGLDQEEVEDLDQEEVEGLDPGGG